MRSDKRAELAAVRICFGILALVIIICWARAALAEPFERTRRTSRSERRVGPTSTFKDPALFRFIPAAGIKGVKTAAGVTSAASDFCATAAGSLVAPYACVGGNAVIVQNGITLAAVGSPVSAGVPVCTSGTDCGTVPGVRLDGSGSQYWANSSSVGIATADFTACAWYKVDDYSRQASFIKHPGIDLYLHPAAFMHAGVTKVAGTSTLINTTGTWPSVPAAAHLTCNSYHYVADGTSVLKIFHDGVLRGSSTSATGPPRQSGSSVDTVRFAENSGAVGSPKGYWLGGFLTSKAISDTEAASLYSSVMGQVTGSKGEAMTFTRASARTCTTAAGVVVSVPSGAPCIAAGGMDYQAQATNSLVRSQEIDNASWTKLGGTAAAPTVTADACLAPDGTMTADRVDIPAVSGGGSISIVYSSNVLATAASWTGSVWMRNLGAGTVTTYLNLRQGTHQSSACSVATSWGRCSLTKTLGAQNVNMDIGVNLNDGAQSAQSAMSLCVWGAQTELGAVATPYIPTAASAVTRLADEAVFTPPTMPGTWCIGATANPGTTGWNPGGNGNAIASFSAGTGYGGANYVAFYINGSGLLRFEVYDSTAASKNVATNATISAGSHRFSAYNTAGVLSLKVDGVSVATTSSGTGTGVLTANPTTFRTGMLAASSFFPGRDTLTNVIIGNAAGMCD